MGGGKSSSSSETDQSQSTLSADGVVTGKVFNLEGGSAETNFTYTDQFPEAVANVMSQLINLTKNAGELVAESTQKTAESFDKALTSTQALAVTAKQPDVALVNKQTDQMPIIIIGSLVAVGAIIFLVVRK